MATARFDMRLDEEVKEKAEKASALLGLKSLSEYVVKLMDADATRVISEHQSMAVENDVFDRFMSACEKAREPNKALQEAAEFTRKQGVK
ncbi:MAG: DUF1778 domain-containing protein [Sedimenticola sp.]